MATMGPSPEPPWHIRRPLMRMSWTRLTFVHWAYDAALVQPLLPPGLTVETDDGSAWIGLVPFDMTVRPPVGPALPWLSCFPETNVRTYVRGPSGETGVWFLSLDAARLPAVLAARAGWGLPYRWARMATGRDGDLVRYASTRHPGEPPARLAAEVRVGPAYDDGELGPLDHFLTARFRLFSRWAGRLWSSRAEHPRWPLHRAALERLGTDLLVAAGLPAPTTDPLVHYSAGVQVRVGPPHLAG